MSFDELMAHQCNIQTHSSSQNLLGEWTYSYTDGTSQTDCRFSPLSAMERSEPSGRFDDVKFKCFFHSSAAVTVDSRINGRGQIYRVKEVILNSTYHHKTAYLVEL